MDRFTEGRVSRFPQKIILENCLTLPTRYLASGTEGGHHHVISCYILRQQKLHPANHLYMHLPHNHNYAYERASGRKGQLPFPLMLLLLPLSAACAL